MKRQLFFAYFLFQASFFSFGQGNTPCTATVLNSAASCSYTSGTTVGATYQNNGNNGGTPSCASPGTPDVWYSFTPTATGSYTIDTQSGTITDSGLGLYSGGACNTLSEVACDDDGGTGTMSQLTASLTAGVTYYLRVWSYSSGTGTFGICITGGAGPVVTNDDPCSATPVTVGASCSFSNYTNAGATASIGAPAPGCANYAGGDVWFTVTVPASGNIRFDSNSGVITDGGMAIYSGTCASLTLLACDDDGSANGLMSLITLNGQTPGATLWIRFWEYGNDSNGSFQLCVYEPVLPPAPANDNCSGATPVTVSNTSCSYTSGTISGATASTQTNGCGGTADDDVWYSFVATSPAVNISLSNVVGGTTDLYHSVYAGSCGAPGTALVCSDPNSSIVTGLTVGNTYFVRIFSWTSSGGQTTTFDLCILSAGACGTPNNQDYCVAPAILSPGTSFSSNTSGTYTSDVPANLGSVFCGSIENNSWYQFVATSTSHTFPITSVSGCTFGIQAQVYAVTEDVNGCCTNFASVSNCYNPASLALGTVTATGLTIGNTYILMVDGNGGSICDFTISGWNGTGILPVELITFTGIGLSESNMLKWSTASEKDNHHFNILRSFNGIDFEKIGEKIGAGSTLHTTNYNFEDVEIRSGIIYYQLEQVDFNGASTKSEVIAIDRTKIQDKQMNVFPNPTENVVFIELRNTHEAARLQLIGMQGEILQEQILHKESGKQIVMDLSQVESGIYMVRLIEEDGTVTTQKIARK
jgi:hypothetical protein